MLEFAQSQQDNFGQSRRTRQVERASCMLSWQKDGVWCTLVKVTVNRGRYADCITYAERSGEGYRREGSVDYSVEAVVTPLRKGADGVTTIEKVKAPSNGHILSNRPRSLRLLYRFTVPAAGRSEL